MASRTATIESQSGSVDARVWEPAWRSFIRLVERVPRPAIDLSIVATLILLGLVFQFRRVPTAELLARGDNLVRFLAIVGGVAPLLFARRLPFLTLVAITVVLGVAGSTGPVLSVNPGPAAAFALYFATFRAVAAGGLGQGLAAAGLATGAITLVLRPWLPEVPIQAWLPNYPAIAVAFLAGRAQRERLELATVLENLVIDLDQRRRRIQDMVLDEVRSGLAADLRDIIASAIGLMSSRAQSAIELLGRDAVAVRSALHDVETTGRGALGELRRLLRVMRADDGQTTSRSETEPDLRRLPELVRQSLPERTKVDVRIEGDLSAVTRPVAVIADRLVREALAGVGDYGAVDAVTIRLAPRRDHLLVEIEQTDRGSAVQDRLWGGLGLVGVREWAAIGGGGVETTITTGGGRRAVVRLPLQPRGTMDGSGPVDLPDAPGRDRQTNVADTLKANGQVRATASSAVEAARRAARRLDELRWPGDITLVAVLAVSALMETQLWSGMVGQDAPPAAFSPGAYLYAAGWASLLLFRRRAPMATAVAMTAAAFVQTYPFQFWTAVSNIWGLMIAIYTVGTVRPRDPHPWVAAVLGAIGLVSIQPIGPAYAAFLGIMAINMLGAAYVGTILGERSRLNRDLEERVVTLAAERRLEIAEKLRRDRSALAREMHDMVAHSMSLMVVQAGAARTVASRDPDGARRAIRTVIEVGDRAAAELEQLLSLVRLGMVEAQVRATHVDDLVREASAAGLNVELKVVGSRDELRGTSLELAIDRIVQEALTNALKYAPGSRVEVEVRYEGRQVVIHVENGAPAREPQRLATSGSAHGLLGMRERVGAFGGQLDVGRTPGGGFRVQALLPVSA